MTTPRDPEALLSAYLAGGMDVLPERVVDSILGEVHRTRQRAGIRPWRTRSAFRTTLAAAAVVAMLALGGVIFVMTGGPSPTPSLTPSPSLQGVVPPSATPSEPSAGPTALAFTGLTGAWIATGSMGAPRSEHTAVRLLDGRVLVVGGDDQNDRSAELYDPNSGTWSATGSMVKPHARGFPATLLRDGTVLVGEDVEPGTDPSASGIMGAEVYDPATGAWTVTGKMVTVVREGIPTLLRDGRVLVVHPGSAELYDPDTGTWSATGKMNTPGLGAGAAVLLPDGKVLVPGGGIYPRMLDSAELYDPDTGSWTVIASMNAPRDEVSATLLRDGTVLVAGPSASSSSESTSDQPGTSFAPTSRELYDPTSAELYDPASGSWTITGDMLRPDAPYRSATLLIDGTVLVIGPQSDPELYDPITRSWTPFWPMLESHGVAPATLLLDGRVLVAGGDTGTAELYDPSATPTASPPPTLDPTPVPTPIANPNPTPTPFPAQAGPVPPGGRSWIVTVVNGSSQPATLFVADEPEQGVMGRLVGSATPNVVSPRTTMEVAFLLPVTGAEEWGIFVNPRPGTGRFLLGTEVLQGTEILLTGEIRIGADGGANWRSIP